jgi:serine/threonine-protein kinase RsbW
MSPFHNERQAQTISSKEDIMAALEMTKEMAKAADFTEMDSIFLRIATEEACMNAYEHSRGQNDRSIEVTWVITSDSIEISVSQKGGAFEIAALEDPGVRLRGRGLALIWGIMDEVKLIVAECYVTFWMRKERRGMK